MSNGERVDFHLRKEVSYGHLISTIILIGMLITAWVNINTDHAEFATHMGQTAHLEAEGRLDKLEVEMARINAAAAAMQVRIEDMDELRTVARKA